MFNSCYNNNWFPFWFLLKYNDFYLLMCNRCCNYYSAPDSGGAEYCDERVCLSVNVCLCVCMSAIIASELHVRVIFTKFYVHVTYGCGSVLLWRRSNMVYNIPYYYVFRDILPVLWMTLYLHISWGCSTSPPGWDSEAHNTQPWAWRVGIPVAGSRRSGLLLAIRAY